MADSPHIAKLYPTSHTAEIPKDGKARMWKGMTDDGVVIEVWITSLRVDEKDVPRFERGLGKELRVRPADELEDRAYHRPRASPGIDPRMVT